ncbi:branched-chain-amino-acid aminotransferase, cytosolic-like [Amphiura filiformis]|uniref:branched-chain-amino-acid aminotransferase, cytosolic-like n=1 Tax=Amphiura filiformis TaxID=82378 RepID=UPI003B20B712
MAFLMIRQIKAALKQGHALNNRVLYNAYSSTQTFKYEDIQIELSKNLKPKPDPDKLTFGKSFTDHMLTIAWSEKNGWDKPQIQPFGNLSLHPAASVLHYALELFEGMKAYRGVDNKIRLFRPMSNMDRMYNSSVRCSLPPFDKEELLKCLSKLVSVDKEWVPYSTTSTLYIRPTYISTEPTLGVASPGHALLFVILGPVGPYFPTGAFNPVTLYADTENVRAWKGGVGDCKMGSNYGPTIMPQKAAAAKGCQQVLWLYGEEHLLTEVGTMNIFVSWHNEQGEKELITPPLDGTILPGVTRKSLLDLARSWNEFKVTERTLSMKQFKKALSENRIHEMFGAGTACVVCPVNKILYNGEWMDIPCTVDDTSLTKRFFTELTDIQYGRVPSDWVQEVD